jgi:hypothetical protein
MNDRPTISPPPRQIREKRNGRTAAERVLPVRNLRSITTQLHIGLTQNPDCFRIRIRPGVRLANTTVRICARHPAGAAITRACFGRRGLVEKI